VVFLCWSCAAPAGRRVSESSCLSVARPILLLPIFIVWAVTCVAIGAVSLRRAPALSAAVFGSVLGAFAGFLIGDADGPAEVPAYTATGASIGLLASGAIGSLIASARPPSRPLRRAALYALVVAPLAGGALTVLLQLACPLYVTGRKSGFCDNQDMDLLGGWVSGVVLAFLLDALFMVGLLLVCAWQAGLSDIETAAKD
jgi:hypothetical protein